MSIIWAAHHYHMPQELEIPKYSFYFREEQIAAIKDRLTFDNISCNGRGHKQKDFVQKLEEKSPLSRSASLLLASREGNLADVKRLLNDGANSDYGDPPWGRSPLSQAAEYNETAVINHLLESGACPDMLDTNGYADSRNNADRTPLMWTITNGHAGPFSALLKHNTDQNKAGEDKINGGALHWVAERGRTEMIKILLEKYPPIDVRDSHHQTSLQGHRKGSFTASQTSVGTRGRSEIGR
ncbi:hypothetical protein PENANT_c015G06506 [Penicillium antarcticum]|uniref:Uncharacterized protein n=1 Tax=Penicillium antarcticum TaxID=416450 RepID=A0A1V6Q4G3_9EURO|nr:hypothetical protein PENANT_c015G06506 [Penicillium antarcticum]